MMNTRAFLYAIEQSHSGRQNHQSWLPQIYNDTQSLQEQEGGYLLKWLLLRTASIVGCITPVGKFLSPTDQYLLVYTRLRVNATVELALVDKDKKRKETPKISEDVQCYGTWLGVSSARLL